VASGFTVSSLSMSWVRQAPGQGLYWVSTITSDGINKYYADSVKGRFTISRDNGKNTLFLDMSNVKTGDTATYYCATDRGWDYFDVWGRGTLVTVSSETQRSPSIYPLSLPWPGSGNNVIMGCLIRDFFPSGPVNVTWSKSGEHVTVLNFPPALASGLYTMSSQLTLPSEQCPEGTSLTCSVQHTSSSPQDVDVPCGDVPTLVCPNCKPLLTLNRPNLEDLLLGSEASLTCTLSGLRTPKATFTWESSSGKDAVLKQPVQDACGCYSVTSVLPGCAEPWNRGETFKCTANHPDLKTPLTATIAKNSENLHRPQVHLLPPPSEELDLNEQVSLTCLMRGFNPKDVLVRWLQGNQELPAERYLVWEPLQEPGEGAVTFSTTSILRVRAEDWKRGDAFSCMVGHEALPLSFTQKTIDHKSGKPTHVNVSVIMSEADGTCY
ncbi:hypothetical protein NP245_24020, partial [Salmonella enterica]|nr:hypothetical protein [Salmonella enterica]